MFTINVFRAFIFYYLIFSYKAQTCTHTNVVCCSNSGYATHSGKERFHNPGAPLSKISQALSEKSYSISLHFILILSLHLRLEFTDGSVLNLTERYVSQQGYTGTFRSF